MSRAFQSSLPLARHRIDRDHAARRDEALLDARWSSPESRVLVLHHGAALAATGADPDGWDGFGHKPTSRVRPAVALVPTASLPASVTEAVLADGIRLYLGLALGELDPASDDHLAPGAPVFAISLNDDQAEAYAAAARDAGDPDPVWLNLRLVAADLDDSGAGVFTEALAMANWHATHTHCPRCGAATTVESGGWVRRCTVQQIELFPRTDAAVIVGIVDDQDRLLLGSNALWANNRFSLLAGFVEPGESLEAAAIREIEEESGVVIDDPQYLGSQPWPFPASLMVGFLATVSADHPAVLRPDGDEILELRWFTRDEIADPESGVLLPGASSIARAIIERWFGGPLPEIESSAAAPATATPAAPAPKPGRV
ncbi:NAD(+) diphosphatase [Herbiconiux sp. P15]|uniref:NAD(+) diphosphatase n=1 Tax=Herbiconiux liukaitaii TaxID=3342799 RepID=UPI0035BAF675